MKEYDAIVIGSGCGMNIVEEALAHNMEVALVDKGPLGFHVVGPFAPIVIQEVINSMAGGGGIAHIQAGMRIHPALPELITATLANLEAV